MGAGTEAAVIEIEANAEECAGLAARFGLLALDHLSAMGRLHVFDKGRRARFEADITADLVQVCVATLEPVPSHIDDDLTVGYVRASKTDRDDRVGKEILIEHDDEDETESFTDEGIDVGEAVAECLGLALDPYPRAADAVSALSALENVLDGKERKSPFAALRNLKMD
jgi:uncharacterized metal-binding protein YceD (DUF177 family)